MAFNSKARLSCVVSLSALAAASWSAPALAQPNQSPNSSAAPANADEDESDITVTGSRLLTRGQAQALPLRVVDRQDMEAEGNPSLVDLIRSLPEIRGAIGNANSSQPGKGQGFEASESINLRGLGPDRNLVLMNGRRLPLVSGYFVNTRHIPMAAIERIEILRDAASTTYGSDAMTGVVNFITRRNFSGFEISADHTLISDTVGDSRIEGVFGHVGDRWNILIAGGYQHRARLRVRDRPWSTPPYAVNPDAGWNFSSNPAQFTPVGPVGPGGVLATTGPRVLDAGCLPLGGIQPFAGFCVNNVQLWQDLVNPADTWQAYAEFNYEISDDTRLHLEASYGGAESVVYYPPSFNQPRPITETVLPANINPASFQAGTNPRLFANWFVPIQNPGLAAYAAQNPGQFPAGTTGIFIPVGQWRPYLLSGNPFFGGPLESAYQTRDQMQFRLSAALSGRLGDRVNWYADLTYGRNRHELVGFDSTGVEIQLALRGLGGPNCQWQTAAPGSPGCLWLNPMSTAIQSAPINGVASNPNFVAATANTLELANWLMREQVRTITSQITEANVGFDGELGGINLGGGPVRWAVGGQWRRIGYREVPSQFADRTQVPCLNSPLAIPNANVCTPTPNTPLGLAVAVQPTDVTTDIFAGFAELVIPFRGGSNVTFGARYEDYGGDGGGTFNPQARALIQLTRWLALRGSVSTTFRAPPQTQLAPNPAASIPTILGQPRALEVIGNPNLEPERATTYNVGILVNTGRLDFGIDYYHYDISNILTTEPQNAIVNALFPNGAAGANNCATLDPAFIAAHFVFNGACSAANLSRVFLLRINGPDARFSGIDVRATLTFDNVFGNRLTIGGLANYTIDYEFDGFNVAGLAIPAFDAVGRLNAGTLAHTLPRWKVNGHINYRVGRLNLRWMTRYVSAYIDQRQATTAVGYRIDPPLQHDFAASFDLTPDQSIFFAVNNIFNREPPLARLPEGYDAMTSDPLERTFRAGIRVRF